jgi:hypothetical protein
MKIRHIVLRIIVGIALSSVIAYAQQPDNQVPNPKPGPVKPPQPPQSPQPTVVATPNTGDDQPIDVSGGSLTVRSRNGQWDLTSGKWVHSEIQRYVTKIEVTHLKDGSACTQPIPLGRKAKIEIYDKLARRSHSVVTIETTNGNQGVKIKGSGELVGSPPNTINFKVGGIDHVELKEDGQKLRPIDYAPATCKMVIHYCSKPFPAECK